jgi:chaperonin cofactor prefoldin
MTQPSPLQNADPKLINQLKNINETLSTISSAIEAIAKQLNENFKTAREIEIAKQGNRQ